MGTSEASAIVIAGGRLTVEPRPDPGDLVIAADSGYDHALSHSISVDLIVGDLDSISPGGLEHARALGIAIEEHPTDKNETDLELALRAAVRRGAGSIAIYGAEGGQLGHLLGVALAMTHRDMTSVDLVWFTSSGVVRAATEKRPVAFSTTVGQLITILPIGDAHDVTATGLRWPLDNTTLQRGTSRGIHNEATTDRVTVKVGRGAVLVIQEGTQNP